MQSSAHVAAAWVVGTNDVFAYYEATSVPDGSEMLANGFGKIPIVYPAAVYRYDV